MDDLNQSNEKLQIRNKRDVIITSRWSCRGWSLGVERTHGRFLQTFCKSDAYAAFVPSALFEHDPQAYGD